jgi:hydroxymethylbilane synthase
MIRIATRRSALARAQAFQAGSLLERRTGRAFELVPMATSGDVQADVPVAQVDVKGMFVDTLRRAVLDDECDLAVHSYKDLPSDPVPGLVVAAVPDREDPRDVLISRDGYAFATLPSIATVGTSSERRRLQLLRAKPGLQVLPLRGNIDTRLRKVADGEYDAIVIAYAGLRRLYVPAEAGGVGPLGLPLRAAPLEPGEMLSAAGQGALAYECRADDAELLATLRAVDHQPTHRMVRAERAFQAALGGGCLAAVGALCHVTDVGTLELAGMVGDPARRLVYRQTRRGPYADPEGLGRALADDLRGVLAA